MSYYLWPLGSNYNNEYMDTDDFLKNCRTVTDHTYYKTVKWRCQPGFLPFNYITNHYPINGSTEEITASGIFSEEGISLNPFFRGYYFSDEYVGVHAEARKLTFAGEGVRLTKLYYRINDGKWIELSPGLKYVSFDMANNGDKIDIQATYQVWTMGNPHSPIPFMWLGDEVGVYNDGKNKFTDAVPVNPGRKYSGIINYHKEKDYNADWQLQSVSWYAPGSTMLESNWAYQNAQFFRNEVYKKEGIYLDTWSERYDCQKFNEQYMNKPPGYYSFHWQYGWNYNYPSYNTNDVTSGWWRSPYKTRKGVWWIYEKTYTDSYTVSGVSKPYSTSPVSNVSFRVTQDDFATVYNRNSKWLNGTKGKLVIRFSGPTIAFADIYAKQLVYGSEIETKIISAHPINRDTDNVIEISFTDYPQLYRSKNIAYYIKIFTSNGTTSKYEYSPSDTSYTALLGNGIHYYNDEPPWISNIQIKQITDLSQISTPYPDKWPASECQKYINKRELYQIKWNTPKDPDGNSVDYAFLQDKGKLSDIIFSTSEDYTLEYGRENDWTLRYRRGVSEGSNENTTLLDPSKAMIGLSSKNCALYNIPTSRLIKDSSGNYIDPLNIWIVPHDGRNNNYYYGTRVNLLHTEYKPIILEVVDNTNELNDYGKIKINHTDYINATVNVKIYAFMSNNPHDKSTGKYIGVIYEGPIEPGYTSLDFNVYSKINGECKLKRGHYIKYAVQCDTLEQKFDPYSKDAWDLAEGYHIYNCLPTAVTPFLCENKSTAFSDKAIDIAWNKSIDNDNNPINYYIYVSSANRPELNTQRGQFWVNGDQDSNYVIRKYCKMVNAGTSLPTKDIPYRLDLSEFREGDGVQVWITAKDNQNSIRYLTGNTLNLEELSVRLYPPELIVSNATAFDLLGKENIDGESGYVKACQVNNNGEAATVTLYAICKKIDGPETGDMRLFSNIATWNLNSGEWSANTKINFEAAFGEEWANSQVRYFAVSTTNSGVSSYDSTEMTTAAYDKWHGTHLYNQQPAPSIIRLNKKKSDLHKNIYIDWGYLIDEDFKDLDDIILVNGAYDSVVPKVFY